MFTADDLPLFERLEVETQSHCNRSCWFCPRVHDDTGTYLDATGAPVIGSMPTEVVLRVLDQAAAMGFAGHVSFYFYSEGLLDKRSLSFARAARDRGMKPYMHTNGDVLKNNPKLCEQVVSTYDFVVVGLYDYTPNEELEAEQASWRTRLPGCDLRFSTIPDDAARTVRSMGTPRALVPSDGRFRVPDLTFENAPCHRPLIRLILRWDGRMAMCCEDMHAEFGLGSIHESTLHDLWHSEAHVDRVNDLVDGRRDRHRLCANCPLPPSGPSTGPLEFAPRRYAPQRDLTAR
jgi:2-deoxy-scyllo-inosamine dehydrogenase (SAM-dependent)/8-amino-3,8-dideoxy-alpha-D-manno-octulosonate transaminase